MDIPSIDDVYEWLRDFAYGYSFERTIINQTYYLNIYIKWLLDSHVATKKPYISHKKLLFGTEYVTLKNVYTVIYAIDFYFGHKSVLCKMLTHIHDPIIKFKGDLSSSYIENIKVYYPGIPNEFINIYHNYILHLTRQKLINHTFEHRPTILAFLIICERKYIPNEIIHMILKYSGIDTYKATSGNTLILNNGNDFTNSIKKINTICDDHSLNFTVKSLINRYHIDAH